MKETGIIMSGNHPRLILDGIKTQTRRMIKPQPNLIAEGLPYLHLRREAFGDKLYPIKCPYGQVGDRLWVKEAFAIVDMEFPYYTILYGDYESRVVKAQVDSLLKMDKRYPSIFMPRWASRILLEITEVRVERVQDINLDDCRREGTTLSQPDHYYLPFQYYKGCGDPLGKAYKDKFKALWDSLNAKRGYGWDTNPWVWVIGFKVVK